MDTTIMNQLDELYEFATRNAPASLSIDDTEMLADVRATLKGWFGYSEADLEETL